MSIKRKRTAPSAKAGMLKSFGTRLSRRSLAFRKRVNFVLRRRKNGPVGKLFIMGCQRSGTSLLGKVIDRDLSTEVLSESSRLTLEGDQRLRLRPVDELATLMEASPAETVCAKPLVESQHAKMLLDTFPELHVLWIFRTYSDLIQSHLRRFDTQLSNIEAIVNDEPNNWRNERISSDIRKLVTEHYRPDMSRADAAALHWYVRNQFLFEPEVIGHPRVHVLWYESFVQDPVPLIASLYDQLGKDTSSAEFMCAIADTLSIGQGAVVSLSPAIRSLCDEMQARLEKAFHSGALGGGSPS